MNSPFETMHNFLKMRLTTLHKSKTSTTLPVISLLQVKNPHHSFLFYSFISTQQNLFSFSFYNFNKNQINFAQFNIMLQKMRRKNHFIRFRFNAKLNFSQLHVVALKFSRVPSNCSLRKVFNKISRVLFPLTCSSQDVFRKDIISARVVIVWRI